MKKADRQKSIRFLLLMKNEKWLFAGCCSGRMKVAFFREFCRILFGLFFLLENVGFFGNYGPKRPLLGVLDGGPMFDTRSLKFLFVVVVLLIRR